VEASEQHHVVGSLDIPTVGLMVSCTERSTNPGEKDDTFGKHLPKWHPELGIFQGECLPKSPGKVRKMKVGEILTGEFIQF